MIADNSQGPLPTQKPSLQNDDDRISSFISHPEKFLIWSNEHRAWWAHAERGYVDDVIHAGRYTAKEAMEICNNANFGWGDNQLPNELPIAESLAMDLTRWRKGR